MSENLIPAIIQDYKTGEVLMLAYMNEESLRLTKETGTTWFWSRSRQKYWNKGETSGNTQKVKEIRYDCDEDTYLVLVEQIGGAACHTGNRSCFYRQMSPEKKDVGNDPPRFIEAGPDILDELQGVIDRRKADKTSGSYTAELLGAGQERILAKISEEAGEVVEAARRETDERVISESADLVYHLMIMLAGRGLSLDDVKKELKARRNVLTD
ncbi:MAG: bifunctional phosphoribosyl-AMP cyclohydrolase/phosphoribosyl-ATP diphosphatase HisIE [Actinomycetota bacterium]|nr:bifunctional phosphoribosyl-AMP cyclohydrolase/phosphoribosyl-ATP diphosphatase HisIE [Actinomycetota bacterium]